MPIPNQNSSTVTVNAVFVPAVQINSQVDPATGKMTVSAREFASRQVQNAGESNEIWATVGNVATVTIPDVTNLAGNAATADLAAVQTALNTAMTDIIAAISAVNVIRKLV